MLSACSTRDPFANPFEDPKPGWATVPNHPFAAPGLPMFDGQRGTVLTWFDLSQAVAWADVIIIGEQHDDEIAHRVQLAIVEETIARFPRTAVSMEMLERDDQPLVDAYLRGEIDLDAFIDGTKSRDWAGKDSWVVFYQPIIDAARQRGAPVEAANAPRRFVRQARLEGYPALAALPAEERALFDLPKQSRKAGYQARFDAVMLGMHDDEPPSRDSLDAGFRSQSLWDSTMAASIIRARKRAAAMPAPPGRPFTATKVIHLVGQFHSDFEGGLVEEISARNPFLRICVMSVMRRDGDTLADEDRGRAAIVIYSGAPREAPSPASPPKPPATPSTPPTDVPIIDPGMPNRPAPLDSPMPENIPWPTTPPGPAPDPPTGASTG